MFWLVAGLGNPGLKYELSRHNLGFWAINHISRQWGIPLSKKSHRALWGQGPISQDLVIISKPQTFMNQSGLSIKSLMASKGIETSNLIVIHDDMDLQLGKVRIRDHGSSGGHKGIISVIDHLNTGNFLRVRLGIGRPDPGDDPVDYVLGRCSPDEIEKLLPVIEDTDKMVKAIIIDGAEVAMNLFNN